MIPFELLRIVQFTEKESSIVVTTGLGGQEKMGRFNLGKGEALEVAGGGTAV